MSYRKTIINQQTGKEETGTVLDIIESSEPIIRLKLENGTLVRIKQSIFEVILMDQKNDKGQDMYNFECNMATKIIKAGDIEDD
ncbi:MAG: hypothetical protein OXF60_10650 [Gammaproteobacteria bacterium]|nr:hypothetical protein [Gammaproteobacteria bacterium]